MVLKGARVMRFPDVSATSAWPTPHNCIGMRGNSEATRVASTSTPDDARLVGHTMSSVAAGFKGLS
jgi:hypothetical protein